MDLSLPIDDFLNSEFGSAATLTTASPSGSSSIRCIFYNPYAANRVSEIEIEGSRPYADCKATDVTNAAQDDTLTESSIVYTIDEIQPEDDGWTRLILFKANT